MIQRTLILVATAVLAATSSAQGFGGGGMGRVFQSGPAVSAMLLNREDVQEELKLSDDQKGKLDALRAGARDRFRAVFTEIRSSGEANSPEDMRKAMTTRMTALMQDMSKEAMSSLDEAQKKRLAELAVQSAGALAVLQPDVAKQIGLTTAQKAKIDDLQRLQDEANQGLMERVQSEELDRDEMPKLMAKNRAVMDVEVGKVLTAPQRAKLKDLGGAPFEFKDPKPGAPGSWGRPGGG